MLDAAEFLQCCLGIGTLMLSTAGSIRLLSGGHQRSRQEPEAKHPKAQPVTDDQAAQDLARRLTSLQERRYASPIVQRRLDPGMAPPVRIASSPAQVGPMSFPRPKAVIVNEDTAPILLKNKKPEPTKE